LYFQPTRAESRELAKPETKPDALNAVSIDASSSLAATPPGSLVFVAMTPCRIADTRDSTFPAGFGPPTLSGNTSRTVAIQSPSSLCPVPSIAQAYSFNVTVVPPGTTFPGNVNPSGALGYLTIWPTGVPQPVVSTLNSFLGTVVANAAIVPAGTNGSVDVFVTNNTDLVIDINGYYAPQSGITLAQGTAASPSMSFAGDAGTGIFSSGTGTLSIATGGTNRLSVRSDGDVELPGSIRKGGTLFLHSLSPENTGIGLGTLGVNTGSGNTATGSSALAVNTTGSNNTAVGYLALVSNTSGDENTAIGRNALYSNTVVCCSTAIGSFALNLNTAGGNTAIGQRALFGNSTGAFNTAIGKFALFSNSTGFFNTAAGSGSLFSNSTGGFNVAFGGALSSNTTGSNNTALGSGSGNTGNTTNANTTGSNNTFIGYNSGPGTPTQLNNATAIGANALVSADNTMVLGSGVSVAIGTSNAAAKLQVVGDIRVGTSGTNGCIQNFNGDSIIGTCSSDARLKQNIEPFAPVLDKVIQLQPVSYEWRAEEHPEYHFGPDRTQGLIAQEVEKIFPDMVAADARGYKAVNYSQLPPVASAIHTGIES
jgi:hypothetical protein